MSEPIFTLNILRALKDIEWGDRERDPDGMCPGCGRMAWNNLHAYGCPVRIIQEELEKLELLAGDCA